MIITVLGLASVGKTTIIKRVFLSESLENLTNVRPTIYKEHTNIFPAWMEKNINLIDLGGQESYLPLHYDPENFKQSDIVIFVVDVRDLTHLENTKSYFKDISKIILKLAKLPEIALFIHKYDPPDRESLKENVSQFLKISEESLSGLNPTIFLTSIYDNTLHQGIVTLIMRVSFDQAINLGLSTLDPSLWALGGLSSKSETEKYLFDNGKMFGFELREIWLNLVLKGEKISEKPKKIEYVMEPSNNYQKINLNISEFPSNTFFSSLECFKMFFNAFIIPLSLEAEYDSKNNDLEILIKPKPK
ncbi:MAG: ADP-ribosylation factor-like protein [Candidatus Hodarchaeales archaeon]|jgi:GTPase SAR1 family protein